MARTNKARLDKARSALYSAREAYLQALHEYEAVRMDVCPALISEWINSPERRGVDWAKGDSNGSTTWSYVTDDGSWVTVRLLPNASRVTAEVSLVARALGDDVDHALDDALYSAGEALREAEKCKGEDMDG